MALPGCKDFDESADRKIYERDWSANLSLSHARRAGNGGARAWQSNSSARCTFLRPTSASSLGFADAFKAGAMRVSMRICWASAYAAVTGHTSRRRIHPLFVRPVERRAAAYL